MSPPPLLVGTEHGLHVLGKGHELHHAGRRVTALAVRGPWWWTILEGAAVFRARRGRGWREVARFDDVRAHCLLPLPGGALVGASEARLFRLRDGRPREVGAFARVPGRRTWFTPWGAPPDTRSLAAGRDGALFANVHVGGIPRSRDRGRTWEPTLEVGADAHEVTVHPDDPRVVLAATAAGLAVSRNGGDTWQFVTEGLHATYQRAVAVAGETVLVSTSRSERGQESAVYRWPLAGSAPARRCRRGLPEWFSDNVNTGCLAARAGLFILGAPEGTLYASEDEGRSWSLVRDGLPRVRCVGIG